MTKRLVSDGVFEPAEAHALGMSVTLHTLLGGRLDAATAVQKADAKRAPSGALRRGQRPGRARRRPYRCRTGEGGVKPADDTTLDAMAARIAAAVAEEERGERPGNPANMDWFQL